jgi:hypothetical protein
MKYLRLERLIVQTLVGNELMYRGKKVALRLTLNPRLRSLRSIASFVSPISFYKVH